MYNERVFGQPIKPSGLVLVMNKKRIKEKTPKWKGPYLVTLAHNDVVITVYLNP